MEPDISVITAMGETLAWSSVQRSVAVAWSEQQKAVRRWDLPLHMSRPETRGFVMLSCAPELSPPKGSTVDSNYRPHYPSQYLGQLFVQRVASLLGAPCLPYFGKPFGSRLGNGSFDGYVADMAAGSLLFVASIALPVTDIAPVVQYLYPVQKDDFCAIIRSPEPLSFLDSVEIVYERDTWIGLAACLLTFAFVQGLSSGNILRALLETYETAVTGGFRRSASLPALWLTLSVCGVVLVNSFTGGLTSYLAVPRIAPSIDTLEQVDSVADVINLYPEYMRRFDNVDSKDIVAKLVNKFRPTRDEPEWQAARASVLRGERRALLLPESHFRMLAMLPRYQRPGTSASLLYRVPQCALRDAYKSFCLPRGSPLLPVLDTLQLRALQSGLYLKFERDSLSNYLSAHAAQRSAVLTPHSTGAQASSSPYSLALSHLQGAFIAFSWAVGVCTVVFAMEVVAQWLPDCQGTLWCGHRRPWNSRHRSMELNQRATWKVLKKWKVPSMQKTASPSA